MIRVVRGMLSIAFYDSMRFKSLYLLNCLAFIGGQSERAAREAGGRSETGIRQNSTLPQNT